MAIQDSTDSPRPQRPGELAKRLVTEYINAHPDRRAEYTDNASYHIQVSLLRQTLTMVDHAMQAAGIPPDLREGILRVVVTAPDTTVLRELAGQIRPPKEFLAGLTDVSDRAAAGYGWLHGYAAATDAAVPSGLPVPPETPGKAVVVSDKGRQVTVYPLIAGQWRDLTGYLSGQIERVGARQGPDGPQVLVAIRLPDGQAVIGECPLDLYREVHSCLHDVLLPTAHRVVAGVLPDPQRTETDRRTTALAKILADLDRCPHGRHEGDTCAGWRVDRPDAGCEGGYSLGNPMLPTGSRAGTTLYGQPIYMPPRDRRHDPQAWTEEPGFPVLDWSGYPKACDDDRELSGLGDLALFLGGDATSFTGDLLKLIAKSQATWSNYHSLLRAFPRQVIAWAVWMGMSPIPTARELRERLTGTVN